MTAVSGVVLAGGRSSRMGTPKALLQFGKAPLIEHIVSRLETLCDDVVVVAAPGQELPALPATLVRDEVAYQGPVGGIAYGLAQARHEVCFVTSCDAVFLDLDLVRYLISQIVEYDVVVPFWQERLQPLHAVYRRSVLPRLREQLERQQLRPVYLFDHVRTRRVSADEIRRFDPDGWSFFNMNTPDDYAEARERWRALHETGGPDPDQREPDAAAATCTVELYGVPRMLARRAEIAVPIRGGGTVSDVLAGLAERLPALVGRVIRPNGRELVEGYACNVNGVTWVRTPETPIHHDDRLVIMSADAGG